MRVKSYDAPKCARVLGDVAREHPHARRTLQASGNARAAAGIVREKAALEAAGASPGRPLRAPSRASYVPASLWRASPLRRTSSSPPGAHDRERREDRYSIFTRERSPQASFASPRSDASSACRTLLARRGGDSRRAHLRGARGRSPRQGGAPGGGPRRLSAHLHGRGVVRRGREDADAAAHELPARPRAPVQRALPHAGGRGVLFTLKVTSRYRCALNAFNTRRRISTSSRASARRT